MYEALEETVNLKIGSLLIIYQNQYLPSFEEMNSDLDYGLKFVPYVNWSKFYQLDNNTVNIYLICVPCIR